MSQGIQQPPYRVVIETPEDFEIILFLFLFGSTTFAMHYNIQNIDNSLSIWGILCWLMMLILIRLTVDNFFFFRSSVIKSLDAHLYNESIQRPWDHCLLRNAKRVNCDLAHSVEHTAEAKSCSICTEEFTDAELMDHSRLPLQILVCGHLFHRDCVLKNEQFRWNDGRDPWLMHSECAYCRCPYNLISGRHDYIHNIDRGIFTSYSNANHFDYASGELCDYLWSPLLGAWCCVFEENLSTQQSIKNYLGMP